MAQDDSTPIQIEVGIGSGAFLVLQSPPKASLFQEHLLLRADPSLRGLSPRSMSQSSGPTETWTQNLFRPEAVDKSSASAPVEAQFLGENRRMKRFR